MSYPWLLCWWSCVALDRALSKIPRENQQLTVIPLHGDVWSLAVSVAYRYQNRTRGYTLKPLRFACRVHSRNSSVYAILPKLHRLLQLFVGWCGSTLHTGSAIGQSEIGQLSTSPVATGDYARIAQGVLTSRREQPMEGGMIWLEILCRCRMSLVGVFGIPYRPCSDGE